MNKKIIPKYFGTDGIRGKYNELITKDFVYKIGKSLIKLNCKTIAISGDTRESTNELIDSLISGLKSQNINVIYCGVIPTPAIIYYTKIKSIMGIMITASHNPYYDNGLKIFNCGVKISLEDELKVENYIDTLSNEKIKKYKYEINNEATKYYVDMLKPYIINSNLKIIIDCANGATFDIASKVFQEITTQLYITGDKPNGININDRVGVMYIENIKHYINKTKFDIGFAFDGDGDRLIVVENNKIISGDQIAFIIAKYLKSKNKLKKNMIVLSMMTNLGILNKLNELNIEYILTPVGDKYLSQELEKGYSIGAESSGHIILNDINQTGDGILVSLFLLKIMNETNMSLSECLKDVLLYEEKTVNLTINNNEIINKEKINKLKLQLLDGKIIVRKSGTENLIRITVMAKTKDEVNYYVKELVNIIRGE